MQLRRRARSSLEAFTTYTKPDYVPNWHHSLLCKYLDRFAVGQLRRVMVFMPPQHGKSELVSRRLPAYLLGRNPDARIIACSYSADLASRMNRDAQRIIDSDIYRSLFPGSQLYGRNNRTNAEGAYLRNSDLFEIVGHQGSYRSAGIGGGITGMGMDFGIIDDPVKNREEADSPTSRQSVWEWYTSTYYSRRSSDCGILITATRWNEDDLPGRLLALARDDPKADQWTVLRLPAVCEEPKHPEDPREYGEALWPQRYSLEELDRTKANSIYEWRCMYQQDPRPEGGTEWPAEWFSPAIYFEDWPQDLEYRVLSLDPSKGKEAKAGDFSAFAIMGLDSEGCLWLDVDAARRPTPVIVRRGIELFRQWNPQAFACETNAYQELLGTEFLRAARQENLTLPMYGIVNMVPKAVRIRRLGPYFAQGRLRVKATPGGKQFVQEARDFPLAMHEDCLDAAEMGIRMINYLRGRRQEAGQPTILRASG